MDPLTAAAVALSMEPSAFPGPGYAGGLQPNPEPSGFSSQARLVHFAFPYQEPAPIVHEPSPLTDAEMERLREITGIKFKGVIRGKRGDGKVGLVWRKGIFVMVRALSGIHIKDRNIISYDEPILASLIDRCDESNFKGVQIVHHSGKKRRRDRRVEGFPEFYRTLTPSMQNTLSAIHYLRMPDCMGKAMPGMGLIMLLDDRFKSDTIYHEVAHLHRYDGTSLGELSRWDEKAGDIYVGKKRWRSTTNPHLKGFITEYASADASEDMAELTGYIYAKPDYVKHAMCRSPIFEWKIEWLYRNGFIRTDQLRYLMPEEADGIMDGIEEAKSAAELAARTPRRARQVASREKGFFEGLIDGIVGIFS